MKNLFPRTREFSSFLNQFFIISLLIIFGNSAAFAANVTTPIGANETASASSVANIVNFTGDNSTLNIDIDKTLYSVSTSSGNAYNGAGTINFNTFGKTLTINNSIGTASAIIQNIIFNNDATLAIQDDIYAENIINATNNNIGTLIFNGVGTVQIVSAKIGNTNNRLQNINVSSTSATGTRFYENIFIENLTTSGVINISTNKSIDASGNLSGSGNGKIKGNSNGVGNLTLSGASLQLVDVAIGSSPTIKLGSVTINNTSDDGVIFSQNIFTNEFDVNGNATISGSGTSNLGIVTIAADKQLTFSANNITMNSVENFGTINIPSGIIINITKDTTISGTLNIGVDYDLSGASMAGQINASGDVDIADDLKINFNFSDIYRTEDENLYPILTVGHGKTLAITNVNQIAVSDNSILMNVSLQLSSDHTQLLAFNGVNLSTMSLLGPDDSGLVQNIFNINSSDGSSMQLLQNQLLNISDFQTLKTSLGTLKTPTNNMISVSTNNLSNRANNIIISHLFIKDAENNKNAIWGQAFNGKVYQSSKESQEGYDSDMISLVFGKDFVIKKSQINYLIGAAAIYSKANIDSKSGTKGGINSFGLAFYNHNIKQNNEGFYNDNIINIAYNKYQQSRIIKVGNFSATPTANFTGLQYGLQSGIGYNFKLSDIVISPNISIKYSRLAGNSYTESGGGDAGLKIKNQPFDNLSSEIGTKITYNNKLDNDYTAIPAFNFGWTRNLKTAGQKSTSSFIAGGDESVNQGVTLTQNIFTVGFAISLMNNNDNFLLTLGHNIEGGSGFKGQTSYIKYRQFF